MRSVLLMGYLLLAFIVSPISAQEARELPSLEVITAENVQQIEQIGGLGRGYADAIAWSPDGEILAVASAVGIWFYDTDFNQIDHWPGAYPGSIREFAWRPDGERLAIIVDERLIIFQSDGSTVFEGDVPITSFSWHPFDDTIAVSGKDESIRLLNAATGNLIQEIPATGQYVAWSPDGSKLAVSDEDIIILDADSFETILNIDQKEAGFRIQWSYDSSMLSSSCFDEETFFDFYGTCVWDVESGDLVFSVEVFSVVWIPDNDYRVYYGFSPFGGGGETYLTIEISDDEPVHAGYWEQLRSLIWHPEHNRLTALAFNGTVIEFSFPSGEIESENFLHSTPVEAISISPDSGKIAATRNSVVQVWNISPLGDGLIGAPIVAFDTDRGGYTQAFVDMRWLNRDEFITIEATYSDYDGSVSRAITLRAASTGDWVEWVYRYEGPHSDSESFNCGWNPSWDYTMFACIVDKELHVYTFDLTTSLLSVPMDHARDIEWSPDNTVLLLRRYIEATTSFIIEIYDVSSGELLYTVDADARRTDSIWNHDLSLVAIPVSIEGATSIQILDTQTYQVIDTVSSEQATWHPSENLLALSADTSLTFWTPSTGILDSETETDRITALDWSDNGRFIATANTDGTIRLWGVPTSE